MFSHCYTSAVFSSNFESQA